MNRDITSGHETRGRSKIMKANVCFWQSRGNTSCSMMISLLCISYGFVLVGLVSKAADKQQWMSAYSKQMPARLISDMLDKDRYVAGKIDPSGPCARELLPAFAKPSHRDVNASSLKEECARNFELPRSVISEEEAAQIQCTSTYSNTIPRLDDRSVAKVKGTAETLHKTSKTSALYSAAFICVFYLNYQNLDNLVTSVKTHTMRSRNPDSISHTVLTMDEDENQVHLTRQQLGVLADVHRLVFPSGTRGGDPLPVALHLISMLSPCPLTVVSDSDAFMLRDDWDQRITDAFIDPQLSLFATNARHNSHGDVFRDVAEWNWMAYRTQAFSGLVIGGGPVALPDVGHYYARCGRQANAKHMYLPGTLWPYADKAATVVTDTDGSPWIMHLFYASRHNNEPDAIKAEAIKYSLNDTQLTELRVNLTRSRLLDPTIAFGLTELL